MEKISSIINVLMVIVVLISLHFKSDVSKITVICLCVVILCDEFKKIK